jgi:hypothetical protein
MAKGKIGGFHSGTGQVLSEGNVYNFTINVVQGVIENQSEIEFDLDEHGKIKVIYGKGGEKVIPAPVAAPKPAPPKKKQEEQDNTSKILLTEEK